ncbi:AAA ATPase containing von Willebrand factor type A (vWA) domain protein [Ceratocystis platani]|uniref:AAA ATPase containing von Willebrand factor type A (VWA) domain protein n=1 Tax=Ceratocystis fimbriata f. sp. platani TaxID=88771 RepID=A0A0F8D3W5_CERFI|nr:AAA ATPase containing von Willebrand factor type A (vWA) domain protein [Ceratocystis platani]
MSEHLSHTTMAGASAWASQASSLSILEEEASADVDEPPDNRKPKSSLFSKEAIRRPSFLQARSLLTLALKNDDTDEEEEEDDDDDDNEVDDQEDDAEAHDNNDDNRNDVYDSNCPPIEFPISSSVQATTGLPVIIPSGDPASTSTIHASLSRTPIKSPPNAILRQIAPLPSGPKKFQVDESTVKTKKPQYFHTFAGNVDDQDDWMESKTPIGKKITINDTLVKENAIRRLAKEVEEEEDAEDEENDNDEENDDDEDEDEDEEDEDDDDDDDEDDDDELDDDNDDIDDAEISDREYDSDGYHTDEETGFPASDPEDETESIFEALKSSSGEHMLLHGDLDDLNHDQDRRGRPMPLPRINELAQTKSLPRAGVMFAHPQGHKYRKGRSANKKHVRGAIDIIKGLERKRQKRKEKMYQEYCNRARKGQKESCKMLPGQGAEKMKVIGLLQSGKNLSQVKAQLQQPPAPQAGGNYMMSV